MAVARASRFVRREKAGLRGRERLSHLDDALESQSAEGKESLRQEGSEEPRQEHLALIAAITLEGAMGESMTLEGGATDAEAFEEAYVEHFPLRPH